MSHSKALLAAACMAVLTVATPVQAKIDFQFDFSYDTNGFFNNPAAKNALLEAGHVFSDRFTDNFTAITPSGGNQWTAIFEHPGLGIDAVAENLTIPTNTILVYAGARDLPGSTIGFGGHGGYSVTGTDDFIKSVVARGQSGVADQTDVAMWGGTIAFDTPTNWNFSLTSKPTSGQSDFYSVAIHELAHLLGFGTDDAFSSQVSDLGKFTGPRSRALWGGDVPLNGTADHWAEGTMSKVGTTSQEAAMDPSLTQGTRKYFTDLDFAAMGDIGWELPNPGDINLDGVVTYDDYFLLDRGRALGALGYRNGDVNGDGTINALDYAALDQAFASSGTLGTAMVVPEPAGMMFVAVAGLGLLRRRRGK